jgi:hypothetical protein
MNNDKRELLKLKQGLISAEDCEAITVEKPPIYEKPTGWAGVQNFFYHHKLHLSFAAFFLVVASILLYFTLTREKVDIKILLIADSQEAAGFFLSESRAFKQAVEHFVPDFDGNGKVNAACLFIDLVREGKHPEAIHGNSVKLFGEVQSRDAMIFVGNKQALENIPASADMPVEDFYEGFIPVKDTALAQIVEFERAKLPDDLYIVIRAGAGKDDWLVWENITGDATTE